MPRVTTASQHPRSPGRARMLLRSAAKRVPGVELFEGRRALADRTDRERYLGADQLL